MNTVIFTNHLEHLSHVCSFIFIELDIHLICLISSVVKQEFVHQKLLQIYVCKSVLCNSAMKWDFLFQNNPKDLDKAPDKRGYLG